MTKEEALKKSGYVPRMGRPPKTGEVLNCQISVRLTASMLAALPGDRQEFIRDAIKEKLHENNP